MLEDYLCLVLGSLSILTSNDSWVTNDSKKRTKALREAAQCKDKRVVFRRRKKQQLVSQFPPQLSSEKVCCGKRAARLCPCRSAAALTAFNCRLCGCGPCFPWVTWWPALNALNIFYCEDILKVLNHSCCTICLLNCVRDINGSTLVH